MNLIFSIMGLIGGLLCCVGDLLFDLKGKGNKKLGTSKNIDSNWSKMAEWRFRTIYNMCNVWSNINRVWLLCHSQYD